jgi:hypothetical protein
MLYFCGRGLNTADVNETFRCLEVKFDNFLWDFSSRTENRVARRLENEATLEVEYIFAYIHKCDVV